MILNINIYVVIFLVLVVNSELAHFCHFLLLLSEFLLSLLLFETTLLFWSERSKLFLVLALFLPGFFKLLLFSLIVLLLVFDCIDFLADPLSFNAILFREFHPDNFVDHLEDCFEDFQRVFLLFLWLTDDKSSSQEARVLVVDLLICDVAFLEAVTVLTKDVSDILVNYEVCCFFRLRQYNQVIALLVFFRFFLVARWLGDWQVVWFHLRYELFEVLVDIEVATDTRLLANEEFNRDGCCLVIVTRESDWNVDS